MSPGPFPIRLVSFGCMLEHMKKKPKGCFSLTTLHVVGLATWIFVRASLLTVARSADEELLDDLARGKGMDSYVAPRLVDAPRRMGL